MVYPMYCPHCSHTEIWEVSYKEYDELIKRCPECKQEDLRQDFSKKFENGFTYHLHGNPEHWCGRNLTSKLGSVESMDAALRENDYWQKGTHPKQKKKADEIKKRQDELGI